MKISWFFFVWIINVLEVYELKIDIKRQNFITNLRRIQLTKYNDMMKIYTEIYVVYNIFVNNNDIKKENLING